MNTIQDLSIADLILINAHIITLDPAYPKADLVALRGGKIMGVEHSFKSKKTGFGNSKVIDCHGKTVLPGFIDAHCHVHAFAESFVALNLDLRNHVRTISDIQSKIRTFSQDLALASWIRGKGYNEFHLAEKRHPTRWDLDEATTEHPIKLTHQSGHAHVLNSLALERVGISKEKPDPPGGIIDRDLKTGEPTGLLYEMGDFLSKRIPPLDNREMEKGIKTANQELISLGITSIQDASSHNGIERWKSFESWKERGIFNPRVSMMLGLEGFEEYGKQRFSTRLKKSQLRVNGVKLVLDETTGWLYPSQSELTEIVLQIHQSGLQAAIHAIEENAIESACSAIEYVLKRVPRSDHRHRIEHCSVCPSALSKWIASLGIMVVTQPPFIFYNGARYLKTVPRPQLDHLYPLRTLMKKGVRVAGSSDCPIVSPNPLIGIYSAISRTSEMGEIVSEKEATTPMEALRLYTDYAAKAGFEERVKGSITPGKFADLVVLSGDPTTLPPDQIKDVEVEMTILDGKVVWDKTI